MSIFIKRARLAKMMLGEALSPFCIPVIHQWLSNIKKHKYAKFEKIIPCGTRVMEIFTKGALPTKMMLGEFLSPFCIPVAGQC